MTDHAPTPAPGTVVDHATIQRPLAGQTATCATCGGPISTWPVNPGWKHRPVR